MEFSSLIFIFVFLPICLLWYYVIPRKTRNLFLLLASVFFYFWGGGSAVVVLLGYIVLNFLLGLLLPFLRKRKASAIVIKTVFTIGIVLNLGFLLLFKYSDFFANNINLLAGQTLLSPTLSRVVMPLGISFFTFQSIAYLIDVYRQKIKPSKNIINYSLFITFFAQLIAGPIVRYDSIAKTLKVRHENITQFYNGIQRFVLGLAKKTLIANTLAPIANSVFNSDISTLSSLSVWIGVLCYTLQIYFDFSGYSDMAIGLGRMFGFELPENFNYPYISKSLKEFWQRWHITLSSWLRDYLYIPLGGNRIKKWREFLNLFTVFLLCGLWHGASWTFVIWGAWHGLFLILEKSSFGKVLSKLPSFFQWLYTILIISLGWVFFRSDSVETVLKVFKSLLFITNGSLTVYSDLNVVVVLAIILALLLCAPTLTFITTRLHQLTNKQPFIFAAINSVANFVILFVFAVSVMGLLNSSYSPFIYFSF